MTIVFGGHGTKGHNGMHAAIDLHDHLRGLGYADRTVAEYTKWARRLARWCEIEGLDLEQLPPHRLRDWADHHIPSGRESRKQAYTSCKHLYGMLGRDDEPWLAIRVPRKRQGDPNPLTDDEARTFRDAAQLQGRRAGMAGLGLLYTAARPGEVAGWRRDGIDLQKGTIRWWREKVRDHHEVELAPPLAEALERYLTVDVGMYLFAGNNGRPHVNGTTVWRWVRTVAEAAGLVGVTPRRLRHTAGTKAANTTHDVAAAAALMGNSVEVAARYYTVVNDERKHAAVGALVW